MIIVIFKELKAEERKKKYYNGAIRVLNGF